MVSVCPEPEAVSLYTLHSQPQPCRSTWECTKVFTDIVSSVFMTTCRTGRVIPSWLVTMHQPGDFLQPYCPLLWSLGLGQGPVLVTVLDAGFEPSSRRVRSLRAVRGGGECADHSPSDSRGVGSNCLREAWKSCCPFPAGESGGRPGQDLETSEWKKVGPPRHKEQGKGQRSGVRRPSPRAATWELWGLEQTISPLWAQMSWCLLYSHGQTSPQHGMPLSPRPSDC